MRRGILILTFAALFSFSYSCADEITSRREAKENVWVCHNPSSEYHGTGSCDEECFYVGQQKVEGSYCWLLTRSDCDPVTDAGLVYEWQVNNCHLLEQ